jgi:hypothetical protein
VFREARELDPRGVIEDAQANVAVPRCTVWVMEIARQCDAKTHLEIFPWTMVAHPEGSSLGGWPDAG